MVPGRHAPERLDFFVGKGVIFEVDVETQVAAIETLVRMLSELGHVRRQTVPSIVDALMCREQLGSTAIGRGIAVTHAKHDTVRRIVGIIGHVPSGIDFNSLNSKPVSRIFLLLSSPNRPTEHLGAIERISWLLRATP